MDFQRLSYILMDFYRFSRNCIDFYGFPLISMVFLGFERFWGQNVGRPLPPCGGLKTPVAADWIPLILRFEILGPWIWRLEAWMLDAGRIGMDWRR